MNKIDRKSRDLFDEKSEPTLGHRCYVNPATGQSRNQPIWKHKQM